MSVATQLYHLQGFDIEIDASNKALELALRQLEDRSLLVEAQGRLAAARRRHADLIKRQRELEFEVDDVTARLNPVEARLYGGQVRNPKELSDLQRESEALKSRRGQLEEQELQIMDQIEKTSGEVDISEGEVRDAEAAHQVRHQKLTADVETLKTKVAGLRHGRAALLEGINAAAVAVYEDARKKRGTAVAKVEQGLCQGCRIALPLMELQKAKRGELVRCGSCGRILYVA